MSAGGWSYECVSAGGWSYECVCAGEWSYHTLFKINYSKPYTCCLGVINQSVSQSVCNEQCN